MRFGICAGVNSMEAVSAAGYDYLEPAVTGLLQPEQPEADIMPPLITKFAASPLKPELFNLFLPGDLKVVGPEIDTQRQQSYLEAAFRRAGMLGGKIVVFGSGGARRIPDGWIREDAAAQIRSFLSRAGDAAERHGVIIAIEPLNLSECNFINSVAEAGTLAAEVGHPAVRVLSDLYHVAHDGQSYAETRGAASLLCHVHVAGQGRRGPVAADHDFLRGYFAVLKEAGYHGRVSIEANWEDLEAQAEEARHVLQTAWDAA